MNIPAVLRSKRVVVDPSSTSRLHPDWTPAMLSDADHVPVVGERVLAVQPEDDGPDYVGTAIVKRLDADRGLLYLEVDWSSFADESSPLIIARGFEPQHVVGLRASRPGVFNGGLGVRSPMKHLAF